MFDPERPNFFMVEPAGFQGIHCRYGMPGIIAESHFDAGRNFIFMVRGRKRYILSSPQQCGNLHMMKSGPSARHSSLDWTSDAGISALMDSGAEALEVILEAGDALYVPSFWFHFIVSLSVNVQCNARSGTPPHGTAAIRECGFLVNPTEPAGLHTVAQPPAGHVVGLAPLFTDGVRVEDLLQLYSAGVDFYADFVQPEFRAPQLSRLMVAPLAAAPGAMARTLGERAEVASFQGSLKAVLAVTLLTLVVAVMVACLKLRGVSAVRPLRTRVLGSAFMRRVLASSTKAHAFQ
ncbi:MAG: hypothetical protein EOO41_02135 [Methanobacteriota archaeon]|nr:MAG: hypothetical protein EOO41_02135 [Euryarchaeota archaeon]